MGNESARVSLEKYFFSWWDLDPHLTHGCFAAHDAACQTLSRSAQLFLQSLWPWPNTQTNRPYHSACLAPVSGRITRGRNAMFGQDCQIPLLHTRPCYDKSSYRLVDPQILHGNVHRVDHVPNGPTNSAAITTMFDVPIATLWRQAIGRGHSRATLRSEPTTPVAIGSSVLCMRCGLTTLSTPN